MVSIITVNYNNTRDTLALLQSIAQLKRSDVEVIVVDNGSAESPEEACRKAFPAVVFVASKHNLGFAGGNNLGIRHAHGEYIFFVNNDTEFPHDIIGRMASMLELHPHIGALCPVIRYHDAPTEVQYAGYTAINRITGRNACVRSVDLHKPLIYTSYAHGAAMMIPRRVIDQAGMMPENYFLYYEELDWCERIRAKGYQIAVDPLSGIYHKESRTVGRASQLKSYFMARNRILFMRRNVEGAYRLAFWLYYLTLATPAQLINYAVHGQWKNIGAHLAGIWWNCISSIDSVIIGYKFNYLKQYE